MKTTSEHPTAAHSSSHGRDEDSEGARMDYRPTCKRSWDGLRRNLMPPPLIIVTRWRVNHLN